MMKYLLVLSLFMLIIACSKSSDTVQATLIGRWKLTETLADPGNGSGTWTPVTTDYTIQFNNDSTVYEYPGTPGKTINLYSLSNDSTIILYYSDASNATLNFKISADTLTLTGGCIEACGSRYKKISVLYN